MSTGFSANDNIWEADPPGSGPMATESLVSNATRRSEARRNRSAMQRYPSWMSPSMCYLKGPAVGSSNSLIDPPPPPIPEEEEYEDSTTTLSEAVPVHSLHTTNYHTNYHYQIPMVEAALVPYYHHPGMDMHNFNEEQNQQQQQEEEPKSLLDRVILLSSGGRAFCLALVIVVTLVVVLTAGIVCGLGNCSSGSSSDEPTLGPSISVGMPEPTTSPDKPSALSSAPSPASFFTTAVPSTAFPLLPPATTTSFPSTGDPEMTNEPTLGTAPTIDPTINEPTVSPIATAPASRPTVALSELPPEINDTEMVVGVNFLVRSISRDKSDDSSSINTEHLQAALELFVEMILQEWPNNSGGHGRRRLQVLLLPGSAFIQEPIIVSQDCVGLENNNDGEEGGSTHCHRAFGQFQVLASVEEDPMAVCTQMKNSIDDLIDDGYIQAARSITFSNFNLEFQNGGMNFCQPVKDGGLAPATAGPTALELASIEPSRPIPSSSPIIILPTASPAPSESPSTSTEEELSVRASTAPSTLPFLMALEYFFREDFAPKIDPTEAQLSSLVCQTQQWVSDVLQNSTGDPGVKIHAIDIGYQRNANSFQMTFTGDLNVDLVYFQLEFGFLDGGARAPSSEEVQELICNTNLFFQDRIRNETKDATIQSEAMHIDWAYREENDMLPVYVEVTFVANVTDGNGDALPPGLVFRSMQITTSEILEYIQHYVWRADPESLFYQAVSVDFTAQVNTSVPIGRLETATCLDTHPLPSNLLTASPAPTPAPSSVGVGLQDIVIALDPANIDTIGYILDYVYESAPLDGSSNYFSDVNAFTFEGDIEGYLASSQLEVALDRAAC